jgi:murein DD-endopeptidase MepM/ murein hydrolase activator NlpD
MRAVAAYKHQSVVLGDVLGSGRDVLDAARRATMLDDVNARDRSVITDLERVTDELHDHQSQLAGEMRDAKSALDDMQAEARAAEAALASAGQAERELRAQLAARKRTNDLATILASARDNSGGATTNGSSDGGSAGQVIVHGTWVCPVQGPVSFTDTFGSPRGGGRTHKGNDLFAPAGTPLVAVTNGSVWFQGDPLGGNAAYVNGADGNTYYYAHLSDYVGGARPVQAGELIGHVGTTGDASDAPPQLHFEIRPGGPNGRAIDPYPTLAAHC